MGKTLELLGLASFNVFIALMLAVNLMSGDARPVKARQLTEAVVRDFVQETALISAGKKADMDSYAIMSYFMDHIADGSHFNMILRYTKPDDMPEERLVDLDKLAYISSAMEELKTLETRDSEVTVEFVSVDKSGKSASVVTTSKESGMMPLDDGMGGQVLAPVRGISYCENKVVLSEKSVVQMAGATCTTDLVISESF